MKFLPALFASVLALSGSAAAPTHDAKSSEDEWTRIVTHLSSVEAELRARDVSHLPEPLQQARVRSLQRLHDYWTAGIFPRNEVGMPFLPRFVEPAGAFEDAPRRVCAVGAIAEADLGADAIDAIAARHESDYLPDIDDPRLVAWAARSGLSIDELAMIQPSYHWMPRPIDEDGQLSRAHVQQVLAGRSGAVNACVHAALGPSDAHPTSIDATVTISSEGTVTRVALGGTTDPPIRACAERALAAAVFRPSIAVSIHTRSFAIVGPRAASGALNADYAPVVLARAARAVDRCGVAMATAPAGNVRLTVASMFLPEGAVRVDDVRVDPLQGIALSRDVRACVIRAVEAQPSPAFLGDARGFDYAYVMATSR